MNGWDNVTALYQVYPRSFMDANNDGVGDLQGITWKLGYFKELGIDAIWLSPVYASPQLDYGYDITNYYEIDPMFGTNADMDHLIREAHRLDMKVVMDFVPNHTSDQHEWFKESRSSRDNPYRDFYVWRDAKPDGSEPNNWVSLAGGKSWEWDDATEQYYLHTFMKEQPDLNWDNPRVRDAMHNVLRFWCEKGVDGFRVDAEWPISKIYADDPMNSNFYGGEEHYGTHVHTNCKNGPNLLRYMQEMTDVVAAYQNVFMIFEYYTEPELGDEIQQYHDIFNLNPRAAAPFVFDLFRSDWHAHDRATRMGKLYQGLPGNARPIHALGNHDQSRVATRLGNSRARALAVVLLTLPGVPTIYYGDELGMQDFNVPEHQKADNFLDNGGMGGRDPERTPMRWDNSENAGFTAGIPWLPIGQNVATVNVESERGDKNSTLALYQKLLAARGSSDALRNGAYTPLHVHNGYVWAYQVAKNDETYWVAANFADQPQRITLPRNGYVLVSSQDVQNSRMCERDMTLEPYEAVLIKSSINS